MISSFDVSDRLIQLRVSRAQVFSTSIALSVYCFDNLVLTGPLADERKHQHYNALVLEGCKPVNSPREAPTDFQSFNLIKYFYGSFLLTTAFYDSPSSAKWHWQQMLALFYEKIRR